MRFRLRQNGKTVAQADGWEEAAQGEIMHYVRQYREEGEVTVQYWNGTHWKRWALFCQWPVPKGEQA